MNTNQLIAAANRLLYTAVYNGRKDTIDTIAAAIWWWVDKQVSAELAGEI